MTSLCVLEPLLVGEGEPTHIISLLDDCNPASEVQVYGLFRLCPPRANLFLHYNTALLLCSIKLCCSQVSPNNGFMLHSLAPRSKVFSECPWLLPFCSCTLAFPIWRTSLSSLVHALYVVPTMCSTACVISQHKAHKFHKYGPLFLVQCS